MPAIPVQVMIRYTTKTCAEYYAHHGREWPQVAAMLDGHVIRCAVAGAVLVLRVMVDLVWAVVRRCGGPAEQCIAGPRYDPRARLQATGVLASILVTSLTASITC